ncbi:hypothetical protein DZC52_12060 [Wenzhouxiangella sediminis]|uniref:Nuclear transport factor 2 family protein n=1 Tax=Wenzhouxiangella sediminis TaxID=1792836 RepID=A0A3E1K6I1_9GAMM|nr:hypothetical protein DZC52_12060 [Wenzhouxiangella sediminis]
MIVLAAVLLLAACAGSGQTQRERDQAMDLWQEMVRWSEYDGLVDMIHPDWLAEHPIRSIELERLRQFRVTEYRVRQVISDSDEQRVERRVQIRLYHVHSARERVIQHREVWRYDETRDRWLLHSGLPDPSET